MKGKLFRIILFLGLFLLSFQAVSAYCLPEYAAGAPYTIYRDADLDGFGDSSDSTTFCNPFLGAGSSTYILQSGDCNNVDPAINPGATEICTGGVDENCNGLIDSADPYCIGGGSVLDPLYFVDADGDGYGTDFKPFPIRYSTNPGYPWVRDDSGGDVGIINGDCDDSSALVNPSQAEVCYDGLDNDCDGLIDDLDPDVTCPALGCTPAYTSCLDVVIPSPNPGGVACSEFSCSDKLVYNSCAGGTFSCSLILTQPVCDILGCFWNSPKNKCSGTPFCSSLSETGCVIANNEDPSSCSLVYDPVTSCTGTGFVRNCVPSDGTCPYGCDPICNNNGVCDANELSDTCPSDCPSCQAGETPAVACFDTFSTSVDVSTKPYANCFIADTLVIMADGSSKNIQDVRIGDVLRGATRNNTVLSYHRPELGDNLLYSFNGGRFFVTAEHPFMTVDGWKAIDPVKALQVHNLNIEIGYLGVGDTLVTQDGLVVLETIDSTFDDASTPLYNFILDGDRTYYADGYLVHNKAACNYGPPNYCGGSSVCIDSTGYESPTGGICSRSCVAPGDVILNSGFCSWGDGNTVEYCGADFVWHCVAPGDLVPQGNNCDLISNQVTCEGTPGCGYGPTCVPDVASANYYCDEDKDGEYSVINSTNCPGGVCPDNTVLCFTTNGVDCDDFDASIVDGSSRPTSNQDGMCSGNIEVCTAGTWIDDSGNYDPVPEDCSNNADGNDNDCDGLVDALDPDTVSCSCAPADRIFDSCAGLDYYYDSGAKSWYNGIGFNWVADKAIYDDSQNYITTCSIIVTSTADLATCGVVTSGTYFQVNYDSSNFEDSYWNVLGVDSSSSLTLFQTIVGPAYIPFNCGDITIEGQCTDSYFSPPCYPVYTCPAAVLYYEDVDNDGYTSGTTQSAVSDPGADWKLVGELVDLNLDCDDNDASIIPGTVRDTSNQDGMCLGNTEVCDVAGSGAWIEDSGNYVPGTDICDDQDNDCDGSIDEDYPTKGNACDNGEAGVCYIADTLVCNAAGDGVECAAGSGTKTENPEVSCGNGIDEDCDGSDLPCTPGGVYCDNDLDGQRSSYSYGTCSGAFDTTCITSFEVGAGVCVFEAPEGDCDDSNSNRYDGATEMCNAVDDDCDGSIDEDYPTKGNACSAGVNECNEVGTYVCNGAQNGVECSATPSLPTAELCDGLDNDCDGDFSDDGYGEVNYGFACNFIDGWCTRNGQINCSGSLYCDSTYGSVSGEQIRWRDADGDGLGDGAVSQLLCSELAGWVNNADDCDDTNNLVGAPQTFYRNFDGDAYGNDTLTVVACSPPAGYIAVGGDCNDDDNTAYPGATEVCDGDRENCALPSADFGLLTYNYCRDAEPDGYGDASDTITTCLATAPAGYVTDCTDCNPSDGSIYPTAPEACDGLDNDCDGSIDEDSMFSDYYEDLDGDTYGSSVTVNACSAPANYVLVSGDCVDTGSVNGVAAADINPGMAEQCNNVDDNCDGTVDMHTQVIACGTSVGECTIGVKTHQCQTGSWVETVACSGIGPSAETCDGLDTDCEGDFDGTTEIDWDVGLPPPATNQNGVCNGALQECGGAAWQDPDYTVLPGYSDPEISCDGLDNDCNPLTPDTSGGPTYYLDNDGDEWLDQSTGQNFCGVVDPTVWKLETESHGYGIGGVVPVFDQDESDWMITYENCGPFQFVVEKNDYQGDYPSATANDWAFDNLIKPVGDILSPAFVFNKYHGACRITSNFCVINSTANYTLDGNAVPRGTFFNGSTVGSAPGYDQMMFCSFNCDSYGCQWMDLDSDIATCESNSAYEFIPQGSNIGNIGEYTDTTRSECCGDDGGESITIEHCQGSTTKGQNICCPSTGGPYFINGGECVTSCPDVMNSPFTWTPARADTGIHQGYNASLEQLGTGYCCDGSADGVVAGGPECVKNQEGCFPYLGLPGTQDTIYGEKEYCPTDDSCVIETCLEGNTYSACELFNGCSNRVREIGYENADEKFLCDDYEVTPQPIVNGNYFIFDETVPGCSLSEVADCKAVERRVCEPAAGAICQSLCQRSDSGELINCQEVCTDYSCENITSYHGGDCTLRDECKINFVDNSIAYVDASKVVNASCDPLGTCNQFGCSPSAGVESCDIYGCDTSLDATFTDPTDESPFDPIVHPNDPLSTLVSCIDDSCKYYEEYGPSNIKITPAHKNDLTYYKLETQCEENFYCDTLECVGGVANDRSDINLRCIEENVSNGNPLIINMTNPVTLDNAYVTCIPDPTITDGDPLCEYFLDGNQPRYIPLSGHCEQNFYVCDWSEVVGGVPQQYTTNDCSNIVAGTDYWEKYNSGCFDVISPEASSYAGVYDQACCYAYSIDDFDVYDNNLDTNNVQNGIRIY